MFNSKKKNEDDAALTEKLSQELIVHNMPTPSNLSGQAASPAGAAMAKFDTTGLAASSSSAALSKPKNNFQLVGILIMIGGLLFIGALVYVSYLFIIKPSASPNQSAATKPAAVNTPQAAAVVSSSPAPVITATTSQMATVTPTVLDLATSTDSTNMSTSTATSTTDAFGQNSSASATPLIDSDNDGLNDLEEAVLGTSATSSDTNHNGYSDLTEIMNNHNPIGTGPLSADPNLAIYTSTSTAYTIIYPKSWPTELVNSGATIIFTAPDNSLIQVSSQTNASQADILTWYEGLFPNVTPSYDKLQSTATWDGIMGQDGLNFYLTDKKHANVLIVSYIPAVTGNIVYPNIFKMMINSLVVK